MSSSRLPRREFLKASAAGAAALTAACGGDDDGAKPPAPYTGPPRVAVAGGADVEASVRKALELAGGLGAIRKGDTVFVKPNAVHGIVTGRPGIVTSLPVLQAVIRACKDRGAKVIVGDRSARVQASTHLVFEQTGFTQASLDAGADEVYPAPRPAVEPDAWVLLQPPQFEESWSAEGGILAMRKIIEADHLINVPVCKNHQWAAYSLSMKNLIGAIGDESRDPMHYTAGDPDRLSRDIAILNQMFPVLMNVIDARDALINGGPEGILSNRVATAPGLIIASSDRLAADAMGCALLKLELSRTAVPDPDQLHAFTTTTASPWDFPQIVHGVERGLGVAAPADAVLRFDEVDDEAELTAIFSA